MAENKKSFTAYCDWNTTFNSLPDDKAGQLIKHLLSYVNDENPVTDDLLINAVFASIKATLKRDLVKWKEKSIKNSESASLRWDKKNANACERIKVDAKHADSVSVSDSDSDILLHNINNNVFEAEIIEYSFTDFWELYPNKTNKKLAEVKFNKLTKEQKDLVEYHLPLFVANKPFKEYNYPHATTYLNQDRYKDEITTNLKTQENERLKQISTMLRSDGSAKYL
jgi:hypothetical protein